MNKSLDNETIYKYITYLGNLYQSTIEEQLYLNDLGFSMEYTDTLDAMSRKNLIDSINAWREEHPKPTLSL